MKSLPTSTFKKLIHKIGILQLKDIDMRGSMPMTMLVQYTLFPFVQVLSHWVLLVGFLTR